MILKIFQEELLVLFSEHFSFNQFPSLLSPVQFYQDSQADFGHNQHCVKAINAHCSQLQPDDFLSGQSCRQVQSWVHI